MGWGALAGGPIASRQLSGLAGGLRASSYLRWCLCSLSASFRSSSIVRRRLGCAVFLKLGGGGDWQWSKNKRGAGAGVGIGIFWIMLNT